MGWLWKSSSYAGVGSGGSQARGVAQSKFCLRDRGWSGQRQLLPWRTLSPVPSATSLRGARTRPGGRERALASGGPFSPNPGTAWDNSDPESMPKPRSQRWLMVGTDVESLRAPGTGSPSDDHSPCIPWGGAELPLKDTSDSALTSRNS